MTVIRKAVMFLKPRRLNDRSPQTHMLISIKTTIFLSLFSVICLICDGVSSQMEREGFKSCGVVQVKKFEGLRLNINALESSYCATGKADCFLRCLRSAPCRSFAVLSNNTCKSCCLLYPQAIIEEDFLVEENTSKYYFIESLTCCKSTCLNGGMCDGKTCTCLCPKGFLSTNCICAKQNSSREVDYSWKKVPGTMRQIDSGSQTWAVRNDDAIFILENNTWLVVAGGLSHVSCGRAGVWGVNSHDHIYFRNGVRQNNPIGTGWTHIPAPTTIPYESIGCFQDRGNRAIPTMEGSDPALDGPYSTRQNAKEKCYQAAKKKGFKIFALQHGGWCGSSATAAETYNKYGKSTACKPDGEGGPWANHVYRIKGGLRQIDSGSSGVVYGVDVDYSIFCRSGISESLPYGNDWIRLSGRFKYVSCGIYGCWAIKPDNTISFRTGITSASCTGLAWQDIEGSLVQLEAGFTGEVYGISEDGNLYTREGVCQLNPTGARWKHVQGAKFTHITTGITSLFGIIQNGSIITTT